MALARPARGATEHGLDGRGAPLRGFDGRTLPGLKREEGRARMFALAL